MRGIHKTYCNPTFLDEIIKGRKNSSSHSIAYNMLNKLSDIIVDLPQEELKKRIQSNEVYNRLNKRENRSFRSKEWIKNFSPDNICDDVFLINQGDIKDYKKIRQEYGCLIIANEPNDLKSFERYAKGHPFNLVPKSERISDPTIKYHDGWNHFFEEFKMTPLNAIIITDNFMFGSNFEKRKEKSLFAILKSIAPKDLKQDFQITIFFNNDPDKRSGSLPLTKEKAEKLIEEIKGLNLCDFVKVTIVAHTLKSTTHDRELISNYHYMNPGVGFSVVDDTGVREVAKGQVQHVFCDMDSYVTVKQLQAQSVMWLKMIFDGEKGRDAQYSYIVGDKENRLFY
ncbi:MAG: hypothetical protein K5899_02490 [Bacteroidaceae bacterium]|nr:hypothetical protein [Bacteroidaceae bacterium]